jgi:hypothetical protein
MVTNRNIAMELTVSIPIIQCEELELKKHCKRVSRPHKMRAFFGHVSDL